MLQSIIKPAYCIAICDQQCIKKVYFFGQLASITLATLTTLISLYHIIMHFINFNNPYFQSKIIVLLLLPPVFSLTSAFSFLTFKISTELTLGRTVFELIALFSFFYLLFSFLAFDYQKNEINQRKVYDLMKQSSSQIKHDFPCVYFQKPYQISSWRKAKYFINRCKKVLLQFILAKICALALLLVFETASDWDYNIPKFIHDIVYWIIGIFSYLAYYYMRLLFNCLKINLKPFKPNDKFFLIVSTIFFIFWQRAFFSVFQYQILACFDKQASHYHIHKLRFELENILICFQMLFIGFASVQAYSYDDYKINSRRKIGSIPFIIKDITLLFFTEMKILKPRSIGFSQKYDLAQTQLEAISQSKRNSKLSISCIIKANLRDCIRDNYF